ncbi:apolipoprotein D [Drosophila busckii]|uniref:apolipoprotein D n=1 Tax=Drosophila busckii TaxID=30019 RepID=UPI00083ED753|nr:apolipoprotein D [Drosophila busckii]
MWSLKCKVFMMLMIARQVLALLVEKGTCPENITALSDFDMDRFRGRWYTYSSLLNLKNNTPECAYVEFIKRANGSYFAKASEINQRTNTIKLSYHGIGRIEPKLGTYEITSRSSSEEPGIHISVLDTDYTSFAICYLCFDVDSIISFKWAMIRTRARIPKAETIHTAQRLAQLSNITLSEMVKIPQDACPTDA